MSARDDQVREMVATIRDWASELYNEYEKTDNNEALHEATDLMSCADDILRVMGVEEE